MRKLTVLMLVALVAGCGKTATIYMKGGGVVEGEITRGDSSHVFIVRAGFSDDPDGSLSRLRSHKETTVLSALVDECVASRTDKCKKACRKKYPSRNSRNDARECMISCLHDDKMKSECKELSTEIPILRRDIMDISHPGKTPAITGSVLTMVGGCAAILFTPFVYSCGESGCGSPQIYLVGLLGGIAAAVGIIIGIGGFHKWLGSISDAKSPEDPNEHKIRPVALTDGERTYWGLGMSWSW